MKYLPSLLKWLIPPFSHRIFLYSATCTPDKRRSSIFYSSETHRMTSHRSGILSSLKTLLVLACVGSSKCPVWWVCIRSNNFCFLFILRDLTSKTCTLVWCFLVYGTMYTNHSNPQDQRCRSVHDSNRIWRWRIWLCLQLLFCNRESIPSKVWPCSAYRSSTLLLLSCSACSHINFVIWLSVEI